MPKWHNREDLPRCECVTTMKFLCVRPARWLMARDGDCKLACKLHAIELERTGWIRQPPMEEKLWPL